MIKRGYACIGLDQVKNPNNIGGVMRAAMCYQTDFVVLAGGRYKRNNTDTTKAYKHIPLLEVDDLFQVIPKDCEIVAVDIVEGATNLNRFSHPERAFYIFGGEDRTLGKNILQRCQHKVCVQTKVCMNLSACVNVVLYDRSRQYAIT